MTAFNAVRVVLENHLATMVPAPPAIAWPNVPFVRTQGVPFIEVDFIPVSRPPAAAGPDPYHRLSGLFYMTVYTPENLGADSGMALVDSLLARFNGSTSLTSSSVNVSLEYSTARRPLHVPPFFAIPVEVGWYAYKR